MRFHISLAATLATAVLSAAQPTPAATTYDAIVVGGGLSGLGTAKHLIEAGKKVLVLEARNRTGGRVHNVALPNGGYTEVGAEFIGPTQDKVIALANELGLTLFEEYNTGNNVYYRKKRRSTFAADGASGAIPPTDPISLIQLSIAQGKLDRMATKIDIQDPWNSTHAAEWDAKTLSQWCDEQLLTDEAQFLLNTAVESIFSVESSELSLLYAVTYIAAAGNETTAGTLERLTSTGDGAQMYKVDGGTELLATRLAAKLGNVVLNAPVKTITSISPTSYQVTLRNGTAFHAAHVVVAMSPPLAGRIQYEPLLPAARDQLTQHMPMGSIGKAIAVYAKPFWRSSGLTGQAISDAGLARTTFDNSDKTASFGALMGFLEADQIRQYDNATEQAITTAVQQDFVHYFGKEANDVQSWVVMRWDNEEFSRGGPVAVAGPNVYTQYGPALKQRIGNLHFAGTESSDFWIGYMDGALRSGYRAAAEVLAP